MEVSKVHYKYPKYKATSDGKIINTNYHNRGIEMEVCYFTIPYSKYLAFKAYPDNKNYLVHRFVWECFNGPVPEGLEVSHIDADATNNRLDNLRIETHKDNCNNPNTIRKKRENPTNNKKVKVKKWGDNSSEKIFKTVKEASEYTKISRLTISRHCNAKREPRSLEFSFRWA